MSCKNKDEAAQAKKKKKKPEKKKILLTKKKNIWTRPFRILSDLFKRMECSANDLFDAELLRSRTTWTGTGH